MSASNLCGLLFWFVKRKVLNLAAGGCLHWRRAKALILVWVVNHKSSGAVLVRIMNLIGKQRNFTFKFET